MKIAATPAERSRKWRETNPEAYRKSYLKSYKKNKKKLREYQKKWRSENPDYRGGNKITSMNTIDGWVAYKYRSIKRSAKLRGYVFNITKDELKSLIVSHCPVIGIELDYTLGHGKGKQRDNSPSVDRIDNSIGYTIDNIIIVSNIVNRVKTNLSKEALLEYLPKIVDFYGKK